MREALSQHPRIVLSLLLGYLGTLPLVGPFRSDLTHTQLLFLLLVLYYSILLPLIVGWLQEWPLELLEDQKHFNYLKMSLIETEPLRCFVNEYLLWHPRIVLSFLLGYTGSMLLVGPLRSDLTHTQLLFLLLVLCYSILLTFIVGWLREWPMALLEAKKDLKDLKVALIQAESIRLGGKAGVITFLVLVWGSLLLVALDVPLYAYSAWASFHKIVAPVAVETWDIRVGGLLAMGWAAYMVWKYLNRNPAYRAQRYGLWETIWHPGSRNLLTNEAEASTFLFLFSEACPMAEVTRANPILVWGKLLLSGILFIFHFLVTRMGIDAAAVPFLDAASALILAFLVISIFFGLSRETCQWFHPERIPPCAYAPMLRLVKLARKIRDGDVSG